MKTIAIDGTYGASRGQQNTRREGRYQVLCRKFILRKLESLDIGCLTIVENGKQYRFGDEKNSECNVSINILDSRAYSQILSGGTIGAGEAYMLGYWQVDNLVNLVRLMLLNRSSLQNMDSNFSWAKKAISSFLEISRMNNVRGSKRNIVAHYDLSNDFFKLFLDPLMMYSSAIYRTENESLEDAAEYKLKHICERLNLKETDHLIEIGSGWGSMAIYAAKHYGCKVTTTTISDEQFDYAKQQIASEGLQHKVELLKKDYRLLEGMDGKFDKLVSIEMIEAVGHQFYKRFFNKCNALLKHDGVALIQAITASDHRFEKEKNKIDFIRRYIFPGGCLPSNNIIAKMLTKHTDMQCIGFEDITFDYARTLQDWRERFIASLPEVKSMGFDDVFIRMWEFYLAYCEGGFRERAIHTGQFLFAKPGARYSPSVN